MAGESALLRTSGTKGGAPWFTPLTHSIIHLAQEFREQKGSVGVDLTALESKVIRIRDPFRSW